MHRKIFILSNVWLNIVMVVDTLNLYSDGTANYERKQIMDNSGTVVIELSMLYPQM